MDTQTRAAIFLCSALIAACGGTAPTEHSIGANRRATALDASDSLVGNWYYVNDSRWTQNIGTNGQSTLTGVPSGDNCFSVGDTLYYNLVVVDSTHYSGKRNMCPSGYSSNGPTDVTITCNNCAVNWFNEVWSGPGFPVSYGNWIKF